jgi:ribosomal protein L15
MGLKAGRPTGRTAERVEHLKAKLVKEEPEMRLNMRMPKSEYRKLKRFAFEREMTIIKVVQVALSEYMSK